MRPVLGFTLGCVLALAVAAAGCHQAERSAAACRDSQVGVECGLLGESPCQSASIDHIVVSAADVPPPRTPGNPESSEIWQLTLADALATALEHSEVIRTLAGSDVIASQSTIYDPAVAESELEAALAVFDTSLETSIFWDRTEQPARSFRGFFTVPDQVTETSTFRTALTKLFPSGAQAVAAFNNDYLFVPLPRLSPASRDEAQWSPNVEFSVRQPLLRGAGSDFNRAPIVIARLRSDQSLWEFKEAALALVRSVEEAYWQLYAAHVALRTLEQVLPLAQEVVRVESERVEFQRAIPADLAQARTQFVEFRQQRTQAVAAVLEREAALRNLLGLPPTDQRRLVPADEPLRSPIVLDWQGMVTAALDQRPDVVRQRLAVRVRELELLVARNGLKQQLDLVGLWRINGIGSELDEAIGLLTDNQFTDWQLGVSFRVPLGHRQASAESHAAEMRLRKERSVLDQTVHSTAHLLSDIVRELDSLAQQRKDAAERVQASLEWMDGARVRFENPPPAGGGQDSLLVALNNYQLAIRAWASAIADVALLTARYNIQLARLEEAKGTLLAVNNIHLQEDPVARVRLHAHAALPSDLPAPVSGGATETHPKDEPELTVPEIVVR